MTSRDLITTSFTAATTADDVVRSIDLRGVRAIVTGASSGLGIETARALAASGADVTLAVRSTDAGNAVARQFGILYRVPEEQQQVYSSVFVNLPFVNGDRKGEERWELPIPATFVLDRDRTVLWGSANEDYTRRPEPADILRFLESLQ